MGGDIGGVAERDASDAGRWLVNAPISAENTRRAVRLLRVPPVAREATVAPGDGAGGVVALLPGGLRCKAHNAGPAKLHNEVGGTRGIIAGFSEDSRRRMIRELMAVDWAVAPVYFITLTYHDDLSGDWEAWKYHLKLWGQRLKYHYGGRMMGYIWRLELMRRKTGKLAGRLAPHFHIALFWAGGAPEMRAFRAWVAGAWNQIAAPGDDKHRQAGTQVLRARNTSGPQMSKLLHYLAKYLGKLQKCERVDETTGEILGTGRIWGVSGEAPGGEIGAYHLSGEAWVTFCDRTARYGAEIGSRYLGMISPLWAGFSIMGDWALLWAELMQGLDGLGAVSLDNGRPIVGYAPAVAG